MTPWTAPSRKRSPRRAPVPPGARPPAPRLRRQAGPAPLAPPAPPPPRGPPPGDWAIRSLMMSLAVTPLRRIANWPKLIMVRRMLGVTALFYALAHLTLYTIDLKLDLLRVASEIALRFYLTIGFVALLGLIALGSTSTDAAIKRLGKRWNRL